MKVLISLLFLSPLLLAQINDQSYKFSSLKIQKKINEMTEDFDVEKLTFNQIQSLESFQVLDSRTKKEFNISHLKGASFVSYDDFNLDKVVSSLDKSKPVLIYCSIGYRSGKIAEKLKKKGFKVYNLLGGIFEWVNNNQPVYQNQKTTQNVHGYNKDWGKWLKKGKVVYE